MESGARFGRHWLVSSAAALVASAAALSFVASSGSRAVAAEGDGAGQSAVYGPGAPLPTKLGSELWAQLLEGNRRFVRGALTTRAVIGRREQLAHEDRPKIICLCCSDSRVPPELVFDQAIGDVYVVRTAGNVADAVALGSLEHAVEHLHGSMLVVLGHENCSIVAAAASGEPMPTPNLEAIVKRIRPALATVDPASTGKDQMALKQVEANVQRSARALLEESPILHAAVGKGNLALYKGVVRIASGEVTRLK